MNENTLNDYDSFAITPLNNRHRFRLDNFRFNDPSNDVLINITVIIIKITRILIIIVTTIIEV